jgi:broad specificity phosphatase PhoE
MAIKSSAKRSANLVVRLRGNRRAYPREVVDRLFVIRHAETRCAVDQTLNGDPGRPCPLTPRGREQAAAIGTRLGPVPVALCITTEFDRTQETAAIAFDGRAIPRLVEPLLNDPPLGELEGLGIERHRRWVEEHDWTEAPKYGGESQLDALRRYVTGWSRVVERPEPCVVVVAHAFTISFARTLESGETPAVRRMYEHEVGLAEAAEVDVDDLSAGLRRAAAELIELGYRPRLHPGPQRTGG